MSLVIATNVMSLEAQKNLNATKASLDQSMERISSGLRINSAKDDAAGMAIGTRMSSQIDGNTQAMRNSADGISLAQTAEGSLQGISTSLQRMRTLAVQSANATNSTIDRASIQNEVNQLVAQINTAAGQASFNGVKLLDGTFNSQTFQIGANAGETVVVSSIASAKADALGVGTTSSYAATLTGTAVVGAIGAAGVTVNGFGVGPSKSDGVSVGGGADSAIAKAAAFNAVTGSTSVSAKANATTVAGAAPTAFAAIAGDGTDSIYVNNVKLGAIAAGVSAIPQGANVAAAFNAVSNQTGVTATFNSTTGAISLAAADGRNISLTGYGAGYTLANTGLTMGNGATFGTVAIANTAQTAIAAGDLTINGVDIGAITGGAADVTAQGIKVAAAINAKTSVTGVTATASTTGVIALTAAAGQDIAIGGSEANAAATKTRTGLTIQHLAATTFGTMTLSSTSQSGITLGGSDISRTGLTTGVTAATATFGSGISTIDVSTAAGASLALSTIDSALSQVNSSRANLGAYQNRFTAVVANLETTTVNISASRSRITDADFAAETSTMTRAQIMSQAGIAMLSQANQSGQQVLSLLK